MFKNIMATGLVAGVFAGLVLTALQLAITSPLILQAEVYETGAAVTARSGQDAASGTVPGNTAPQTVTGNIESNVMP